MRRHDHMQCVNRLSVIGGASARMLGSIGAKSQAVETVALLRLLGNIGWSKPGWPGSRYSRFQAKVTGAAKQFPCV